MSNFKKILLFILLFMFFGCGFRLAGEGTFSNEVSRTHVQSHASSKDLERLVEKNLKANNLYVVNSDNATAILRILKEETDKTVLTLDSDGKAREFELLLHITFDVKKPDNSVLLKLQNIDLKRDFVFDKSDLLGANEEEQELFNEMRNDAAKIIVYRLQKI